MSDSFFDMPAGYSDTDLEMAELERRGTDHYRRYGRRKIDAAGIATLTAGGTVTLSAVRRDTAESYTVELKATDTDEIGPCSFRYTMDRGITWYDSAREAYDAWKTNYATSRAD